MSKSKFYSKRKYWIVTKCPVVASTIDDNDRKLCEHPGLNGDLETLQPVSDLSGTTHFVNKYCAFCNGRYDIETRAKWKLEVHCDEIISLTDENLFSTLVSKQCNILYQPPSTAVLKECQNWQNYTISTCNETGKWDTYDKFLDLACNAFVDPLNETYKNYFCMLCNTRARQSTGSDICYIDHENIVSVSPPFFAILDIDLWKEQKGETPRLRCGTSSQFSDNKLVGFSLSQLVCPFVFAYAKKQLY